MKTSTHPDDSVVPASACDPEGLFSGLWWEHGSAKTTTASESFLAEYARQSGPPIDAVVADTEEWMGLLAFESGAGHNDPCAVARLNAVQRDPRFPAVLADLIAADDAFADVVTTVDGSLHGTMCRQGNRASRCFSSAMAWDAVMLTRVAAAMDAALYHPFRAAFPAVKFSNYMFRRWRPASTPELTPPARNGALFSMYGTGAINGNLQSHPAYGSMNYLIRNALVATVPGLDAFDETSPFNAMLYDVNTLRSQKLVPGSAEISPWITCKHQEGSPPSTLLYGSVFYDEQVFHLALTGIHSFNAWQPLSSWSEYCNPAFDDNLLLSRLLRELNARVGCVSSTSALGLAATLAPWDASFLLSGVVYDGIATYRFTPRTAAEATQPAPVQSGRNVTVDVLPGGMSHGSAGRCTLVFVSASLVQSTGGGFAGGVWISQHVVDGGLIVAGTCPPDATTLTRRPPAPGPGGRSGCTDQTAGNYDAAATVDDGSCTCVDASAAPPCPAATSAPSTVRSTADSATPATVHPQPPATVHRPDSGTATTTPAVATSASGNDDSASGNDDLQGRSSDTTASNGAITQAAVGITLAVLCGGAVAAVAARGSHRKKAFKRGARQPGADPDVAAAGDHAGGRVDGHGLPIAKNPMCADSPGSAVNGATDGSIAIQRVRGSVRGSASSVAAEAEMC